MLTNIISIIQFWILDSLQTDSMELFFIISFCKAILIVFYTYTYIYTSRTDMLKMCHTEKLYLCRMFD